MYTVKPFQNSIFPRHNLNENSFIFLKTYYLDFAVNETYIIILFLIFRIIIMFTYYYQVIKNRRFNIITMVLVDIFLIIAEKKLNRRWHNFILSDEHLYRDSANLRLT